MEGYLTIPDAAARFGVKTDRLRRAVGEGRLVGEKIGSGRKGVWLVKPEEVERFLREHRMGPKPKPATDTAQ